MNAPFIRPPVAELGFRTYDRVLHPEFFDSIATLRIERPSCTIVVRILPTGHVLEWRTDRAGLTEWIAGTEDCAPQRGQRIAFGFQAERRGHCNLPSGIEYQVSAQLEILPPEVFAHVHAELAFDGSKRGLLFHFQPHNRLGLTPLGYVAIDPVPRGLSVTAFHTFPDEFAVVKTQSLIEAA